MQKSVDQKEIAWLLAEKYKGTAGPDFDADCARLAAGEPLAYVIGWQPFLGLTIHLDSHPLIPRPETEWWLEQLIEQKKKTSLASNGTAVPRFLDLCAGSGAVGCAALKYLPNDEIYFGEIDPAHETTIRKNIAANNLDASRAHIGIGDLFVPFGNETFDIIAANPPYIPNTRVLDQSVVEHEPPMALFAGPDGLEVIRRIAAALPRRLAPHGIAWIECDSAHIEEARTLFAEQDLSAEIRTDQHHVPRLIVVS